MDTDNTGGSNQRAPGSRSSSGRWSLTVSIGAPMVAILFVAIGAMAWWFSHTQSQAFSKAHARQIETVGAIVSQSAEVMLAAGELSALRRLTAETAREYGLALCRVVLPDGQIVADADPTRITAHTLPARWSATDMEPPAQATADGRVSRTYALSVVGRGPARLEIAAGAPPLEDRWEQEAGVGAISIGAMGLLLVFFRRLRVRLRAMSEVRGALLASDGGEVSSAALAVAGEFGPEAVAWNNLLGRHDDLRKQVMIERAKEAVAGQGALQPGLEGACDALPQGMLLVDEALRVRYANGAAAKFLQAKREDILGAEVGAFLRDAGILEVTRTVAGGTAARRTVVEIKEPENNGVLRFIVRPVRKEDGAAAMIIIEDITQQRVAEESRDAFVAQATHELRTPLTNIRLYVETALDEGEKDPAVRAQSLNVINQEARRLERLVSDILSITEIEAGSFKVKKEDVRVDALFQDLESDYKAQAESKAVRLVFDLPPKLPVLLGDRDKFAVALHNLVGNALKYTPPGGQVVVSAEVSEKELIVEVADTGIGISEEDARDLFKKFHRAKDPRVAKIPGSGLGLALAREVVRLYGGDILLKSELNKGSTFTVILPVRSEAA